MYETKFSCVDKGDSVDCILQRDVNDEGYVFALEVYFDINGVCSTQTLTTNLLFSSVSTTLITPPALIQLLYKPKN